MAAAALLTTFVARSEAQAEESIVERIRAGVFVGGNFLSTENELGNAFHPDQVPGSGFLFGLQGSYLILDSISPNSTLDPHLSAEIEAKVVASSTDGADGRDAVASPVVGWRASAILDLNTEQTFSQFLLTGIGGETVFGDDRYMTTPDTDFAWYFGGGVRYEISKTVGIRSDVRLGFTAGRVDPLASLFEFHLGATYRFGQSGEEALVEDVVEKPEEPVEDLDQDHDGIPDADDACPQLAEIMNNVDDEDGCPEVDSDNDGLVGSQDQCPAAAEDKDGFKDEDGCPDSDNDDDGRPDIIDQCPGKPENLNGFEDEDGCPDEIPMLVQEFTGRIEGIKFKTGSARILRKTRKTLQAAFEVLAEHESVRIEISGHTDNEGKADANRALSRRRADYVKWYLVDKGIDATRIVTIGHGPDRPVGDNDTQDGRRLNRRIEFRLLPGAAKVAPPE